MLDQMRILFVHDYGDRCGGAEKTIIGLREAMRRRGHEAALLASSARLGAGATSADMECWGTTGPFRTVVQSANPFARQRLAAALSRYRPDVVHVGSFLTQLSPLILPLLRDVPSVLHVMWLRSACPTGTKRLPDGTACTESWGGACLARGCLPFRDWLPLMAQMRMFRRWRAVFDAVLVESETMRRAMHAEGMETAEVVGNAVEAVGQRPFPGGRPCIFAGGRLVPTKGFAELVEAFAIVLRAVPDARLVIAGDGPEAPRLARLARTLCIGDAVSFPGWAAGPALESLYRDAWIAAVPSLAPESFCLMAAEAMARGIPVVATDAGALPDTVGEGGSIVAAGDVAGLAQAIVPLLTPARAAALGETARRSGERRFDFEEYCSRIERVHERVVRGTAGGVPGESRR
jgi:glycosyltransferase involved in cell wall biosynthesis